MRRRIVKISGATAKKQQKIKVANSTIIKKQPRIKPSVKVTKSTKMRKARTNVNVDFNHVVNLSRLKVKKGKVDISKLKIGVCFHIYYSDIVDEIIENLNELREIVDFQLFITSPEGSPFDSNSKVLLSKFSSNGYSNTFLNCRNIGKDIGGKMCFLRHCLENDIKFDYLVFAHDKKSTHAKESIGRAWRKDLYRSIFNRGSVEQILACFGVNNEIKMAGGRVRQGRVHSSRIAGRGSNFVKMQFLSKVLKIQLPETAAFIGGTMFWVKGDYFLSYFNQKNVRQIEDQLETGDVQDGSFTHAMERILGILVTHSGNKIGSI